MVKPRCPYFGRCGGCSFQDVEYSRQLEEKRRALGEAAGFRDIQVFPGEEYGYRNRMDMIFHSGGLGFRLKGTWHTPVDVERCEISNELLNELILEIREFFGGVEHFDLKRKRGTFRYAVIRTPSRDSSISFVLNEDSPGISQAEEKIREFTKSTSANNVLVTYVPARTDVSISGKYEVLKGGDLLEEELLGMRFRFPVQGFFQNNTAMAEKMHKHVNGLLGSYKPGDAHLLDLYGGVGTFGIVNSGLFAGVTIVEDMEKAVKCAIRNARENGAGNVKPVLLKDRDLREIDLPQPLYVVADPPRAGIHPKAMRQLNNLGPGVIVYVSCNPRQLENDLKKLEGYSIKSAALFDFFPQTPHSEAVLELVRK